MTNQRQPTFRVSAGLLDPKHARAIGTSVWEFLACLSWQTDDAGRVLGGKPVTVADFQDRTGHSADTTRRNLERLKRAGYIKRVRVPHGFVVEVANQKKFVRTRKNAGSLSVVTRQKCGSDPAKMHDVDQIVRDSKKEGNTPTTFECSHPDCSSQTYHLGRVVAEQQGLRFPADVGSLDRWLKESKPLAKYADADITEFVEFKIKRESPKWDSQPLRPAYVAEDIGAYLRKKTNGRAAMPPTEAELQAYADRQKGVGA